MPGINTPFLNQLMVFPAAVGVTVAFKRTIAPGRRLLSPAMSSDMVGTSLIAMEVMMQLVLPQTPPSARTKKAVVADTGILDSVAPVPIGVPPQLAEYQYQLVPGVSNPPCNEKVANAGPQDATTLLTMAVGAVGATVTVTVMVEKTAHGPGVVYLIEYTLGEVAARFIFPVVVLANTNPAGVAENIPPAVPVMVASGAVPD